MLNSVTLEISLKPFKQTDEQYIRKVCSEVFKQWYPLIKNRKVVSIMLWIGDGSEILDYAGNFDDEFEWAYFLGTANNEMHSNDDHIARSLHEKKRLYIKNPPVMTYGILKRIVEIFKEEAYLITVVAHSGRIGGDDLDQGFGSRILNESLTTSRLIGMASFLEFLLIGVILTLVIQPFLDIAINNRLQGGTQRMALHRSWFSDKVKEDDRSLHSVVLDSQCACIPDCSRESKQH